MRGQCYTFIRGAAAGTTWRASTPIASATISPSEATAILTIASKGRDHLIFVQDFLDGIAEILLKISRILKNFAEVDIIALDKTASILQCGSMRFCQLV